MELVTDAAGNAAPRLNDLDLNVEQALAYHAQLLRQVVLMLCAGVIHGDLSEYNILVDTAGPVIIDLPQAIDAASNTEAGAMLERDVANLAACLGRFAPEITHTQYGKEIWALYSAGLLRPDTVLTGRVAPDTRPADVRAVLREIDIARQEEEERQRYLYQD
jgi:RIO kinase 1